MLVKARRAACSRMRAAKDGLGGGGGRGLSIDEKASTLDALISLLNFLRETVKCTVYLLNDGRLLFTCNEVWHVVE